MQVSMSFQIWFFDISSRSPIQNSAELKYGLDHRLGQIIMTAIFPPFGKRGGVILRSGRIDDQGLKYI